MFKNLLFFFLFPVIAFGQITISDGTCSCSGATVGDTEIINGVTYTVVNNSTIAGQISATINTTGDEYESTFL